MSKTGQHSGFQQQVNSSNPPAVLWDMDGTLADTGRRHWQAWHATLAGEGVELDWEKFLAVFGQRNDLSLRAWIREDLAGAEISRISEAKEALYRQILADAPLALMPGAERWLRWLRSAGWKQALATMNWRQNLDSIFSALESGGAREIRDWFDAIVTADDVAQGKPDPEVFLLAARRLGVPPARCVVLEDAAAGIEAARRAGMRSIGIGPGAGGADLMIASLLDLPEGIFETLIG